MYIHGIKTITTTSKNVLEIQHRFERNCAIRNQWNCAAPGALTLYFIRYLLNYSIINSFCQILLIQLHAAFQFFACSFHCTPLVLFYISSLHHCARAERVSASSFRALSPDCNDIGCNIMPSPLISPTLYHPG